jgi:electron transfer flavoprotein alpha subunit
MILIVAEVNGGALSRSTLECIQAASALGPQEETALLLLGSGLAAAADQAVSFVPQVLVADLSELTRYDPILWAGAVSEIAQQGDARCVMLPATRAGREYSPRVAVRLGAALLEDVVALQQAGEIVRGERYSYLARVRERVESRRSITVITTKPGAFALAAPITDHGEQFDVSLQPLTTRVRITGVVHQHSTRVPLTEADIVVSGGRGIGSPEGFTACVETLADRLGAAIGVSRAVVDAGWRPYEEQVGQTGKTVQPTLYIALGISGAVQHLSGMNKSRYIAAINRDANSPIFRVTDFGIVGQVHQIVPEILKLLP